MSANIPLGESTLCAFVCKRASDGSRPTTRIKAIKGGGAGFDPTQMLEATLHSVQGRGMGGAAALEAVRAACRTKRGRQLRLWDLAVPECAAEAVAEAARGRVLEEDAAASSWLRTPVRSCRASPRRFPFATNLLGGRCKVKLKWGSKLVWRIRTHFW